MGTRCKNENKNRFLGCDIVKDFKVALQVTHVSALITIMALKLFPIAMKDSHGLN